MPSFVIKPAARPSDRATPEEVAAAIAVPEILPRNCRLKPYAKLKTVPAIDVDDEIVAYASPDSTFAVTKGFLDGAQKSILIGIYDFSSDAIKELLLKAMRRGVKVKLMLDIDSKDEQAVFDDLAQFGATCVEAPSCASKRARYFSSSHEKVIVIDGEWCLVQSGNYSVNSIPPNAKDGGDPSNFVTGNRDSGLAIRSKPLARFFTKVLDSDIALELDGPEALGPGVTKEPVLLVEAAPKKIPVKRFTSKRFKLRSKLSVQPVLSPDNYMDVVPDAIRAARRSVLIEQQYIRSEDDKIIDLLDALKAARRDNSDLDIRIILGKIFSRKDLPKERRNLDNLSAAYGLKLGRNIRYIDTSRFVHCHNKMVLIDGKRVLVSSQNWSRSAVWQNREAGVLLDHAGICSYFTQIFKSDWSTAVKQLPGEAPETLAPETVRSGKFIRVEPGDYREV
jgi:phosphatidylserine/phosphatidylglycerophosphate/cardiolipin synthase-like enzyme